MEGGYHAPLAVGYQNGDAVGGPDAEQQAGLVGHQAVGTLGFFPACFRRTRQEHQVGMNLVEIGQRGGRVSADSLNKKPAIPGYGIPVILIRKAKI